MRCLHERARRIVSTERNLKKEMNHLSRVLMHNGYPANFIRTSSVPVTQEEDLTPNKEDEEKESQPLMVIPYIAGLSEDTRRVCREFNIRVVFKSGRTLRSMLVKVKDMLPVGKQSNVVYSIPCSCGQVYIGETKRRLETRLKEHRYACKKGMTEISVVAEHAWENSHSIDWEEMSVLDKARGLDLLMKEALHIWIAPVDKCINKDGGLEIPDCWTALVMRHGGMRF